MSNFKRWPYMKHGSRTRIYQLERFATVDPASKYDCIMLDGSCECESFDDCKYIEEVDKD